MFSVAAASLFLPFLPMLSIQILLNNLPCDLPEFAIPTDNIDQEVAEKPSTVRITLLGYLRKLFT
jgi:Mg2+-importing ATPase